MFCLNCALLLRFFSILLLTSSVAIPSFGQQSLEPNAGTVRRPSPPRVQPARQEEVRIKPIQARIGQISVEEVAVRSGINGAGKVLTYLEEERYVAIVVETPDYVGVMMEDRSVGWINRLAVRMLNHEVTLFQTIPRSSRAAATRNTPDTTNTTRRSSDTQEDEQEEETPRTPRRNAPDEREIVIPAHVRGLIEEAVTYLGVPYKWGGMSREGLDCSAFIKNVFETQGVTLPRVSRQQALVGEAIEWKDLQCGDRLYFTMGKDQVSHCGIYISEGYFIHASTNHRGVAVDKITTPAYYKTLVAIRRSL